MGADDNSSKRIDFEKALEKAGVGKFNYLIIFVGGMTSFLINSECYSIGYVLTQAACEFELDDYDMGWLTSVGFIGIISTSHLWGYLADTKGRKLILNYCLFASFITTILSCLVAMDVRCFLALRFLNGICLSGMVASVYAYIGEFHGAAHRTKSITVASMMIAVAFIFMPGMAYLILNSRREVNMFFVTYSTWRMFMLLCGTPALLLGITFRYLPESPKFLLNRKRKHEALAVLKIMYSVNTGKAQTHYPVGELEDDLSDESAIESESSNFFIAILNQTGLLFKKRHFISITFACSVQFILFATSSGMFFWFPAISESILFHEKILPNQDVTVCRALFDTALNQTTAPRPDGICTEYAISYQVLVQNITIGGSYVVGFIFIIFCVSAVGNTILLVTCLCVSGLSSISLCFATSPPLINILFIGVLTVSGLCVTVLTTMIIDLFPTNLCAMAVSLSFMVGRLGSIVASTVMGTLLLKACWYTFMGFGALLIAFGLLTILIRKSMTNSSNDNVGLPLPVAFSTNAQ